jgi:hypothetical protein
LCTFEQHDTRSWWPRATLALAHTRNTLSPGSEAYTYHHWQKAICLHDLVHQPRANVTVTTQLLVRPAVIIGNSQIEIILISLKISKLKNSNSFIVLHKQVKF